MANKIDPASIDLGKTQPNTYSANYLSVLLSEQPAECALPPALPLELNPTALLPLNPACAFQFPDVTPLPPVYNPPNIKFLACETMGAYTSITAINAAKNSNLLLTSVGPKVNSEGGPADCALNLTGLLDVQACESFSGNVNITFGNALRDSNLVVDTSGIPDCGFSLVGNLNVDACETFTANTDISFRGAARGSQLFLEPSSSPDCGVDLVGVVNVVACETFSGNVDIRMSGAPVAYSNFSIIPTSTPNCGFDLVGDVVINACADFKATSRVTIGGTAVKSGNLTLTSQNQPYCGVDLVGNIVVDACQQIEVSGKVNTSGALNGSIALSSVGCGINIDGNLDVQACETFTAANNVTFGGSPGAVSGTLTLTPVSSPNCGVDLTGTIDVTACTGFTADGSINFSGKGVKSSNITITPTSEPNCGITFGGAVVMQACESIDINVSGLSISGPPVKSPPVFTFTKTGGAGDCTATLSGETELMACYYNYEPSETALKINFKDGDGNLLTEQDINLNLKKTNGKAEPEPTCSKNFVLGLTANGSSNLDIVLPTVKSTCPFTITDASTASSGPVIRIAPGTIPSKQGHRYPQGMDDSTPYYIPIPDNQEWHPVYMKLYLDAQGYLSPGNSGDATIVFSLENTYKESTYDYMYALIGEVTTGYDADDHRVITYIQNYCYVPEPEPNNCPFEVIRGEGTDVMIRSSSKIEGQWPVDMQKNQKYYSGSNSSYYYIYCVMSVDSSGKLSSPSDAVWFVTSDTVKENTDSLQFVLIAEVANGYDYNGQPTIDYIQNSCTTPATKGGVALDNCPFRVSDATENGILKIRIAWGTIEGLIPTGMFPNDTPQLIMDVEESGFAYAVLTFDTTTFNLTGTRFEVSTTIKSNTAEDQYWLIAYISVGNGAIDKITNVCQQPVANPCSLSFS